VRYRARGPLRDVVVCHCRMCQRIHGQPGAYSAADRGDLELLKDEGLAWYASSPGIRRGFCRLCGATVFWDAEGRSTISIAAGTIDPPTGLRTVGHIYTADKGDYYTLTDGLPAHAAGWPR
jgi:hypothetical protein